jgi:phosphohistidine swiveling domain-containing protein
MTSRCVPIADAEGTGAGGKAEGLARLVALGLRVPDAFVVLDATPESLPDDLETAYQSIGRGRVSVRSSASDEDGQFVSFAGQHATVLDVEGVPALRDAVVHCLRSLTSERAQAYRKMHNNHSNGAMSVVVQRMVDARCAGVVFTADPVTARRDRLVVEAVEGLGNALVGGSTTPDHFTLARDGALVKSELPSQETCVQPAELSALASGAVRVERDFERPVECEWAIDYNGGIEWLQARPITTLPADPRELDSKMNEEDVYSRCNIGEIFPGIATPLTWSTSLYSLDQGMQRMYRKIATLEQPSEEPLLVVQSFGYPFMNLTQLAAIARSMAGGSEVDTVEALCGRPVPEIVPGPRAPQLERISNGLRYVSFMFFGRHVSKLDQLIASIDLEAGADAHATCAKIDRELTKLNEAWYQHLGSSLLAGSLVSALPRILATGEQPTEQDDAQVAMLLAGAEGVESYDIAAGIDRIVTALVEHDQQELDRLLGLDVVEAERFLRREASSAARSEFSAYLERHGHRCVREVEMREKEWAEDPTPIVEAVLSGVRAKRAGHTALPKAKQRAVPLTMRLLVKVVRRGVRARERTKSQTIQIITLFKRAYRALARQMVEEGLLPDEDLVFFLQHAELDELLRESDSKLAERAVTRRDVLPFQMKLTFPQNFRGKAEPIVPSVPSGDGLLHGKPASLGVVRGRARVALTLDAASEVQPGEILIVPIVDVGWTPSFATIAGFASDVGSAISHGAVVAREYGLPMLVNLRLATKTFHTGDLVELDADRGVLRRITEE